MIKPYYEDKYCKVYNGDAREIIASFPECLRVNAVITDPPYGVGFKYASFDDGDFPGYARLIGDILDACQNIAPLVLTTCGMKNLWLYPPATHILCWAKPGSTRMNPLGGFSEWEPVLV